MATLLIVDDETEICDILEDTFQQEKGFAVLKTDNGPDAVELIKKHHPDVIILDIKLQAAGMDGVEVLREIKKHHPKAGVIVITGFVDEAMEDEIRGLGIDSYLEKPFVPPQIINTVNEVLQKKWSNG